jgi:cyanophycinase
MKSFIRLVIVLFLAPLVVTAQNNPRGNLIIIGGGGRTSEIMKKFVELAGGAQAKIVVFPMASSVPEETGREQTLELKQLGATQSFFLRLNKQEANTDSSLSLLEGVTGVFFTGGDQSLLTAALKGTKVEQLIHQLYRDGAVLGGTSAGAAVMSAIMITGDERRPMRDSSFNTIETENIVTSEGFGFIENAIVDQHFVRRRRHNRLMSLILEHPNLVGIGIDESTAIWVSPDQTFEVLGKSVVLIYDATSSQIKRDNSGFGIQATDITLHILRSGSSYDLKFRKTINIIPMGAAR